MLSWKPEYWFDLANNLMQPMILQIKFGCDRSAGCGDRPIHVWMCGWTDTLTPAQSWRFNGLVCLVCFFRLGGLG